MGKYCAFHDTNGHETEDCRHLKYQTEELIRGGYLPEFLAREAKRFREGKAFKEAEQPNTNRAVRVGSIRTIIRGPHIGGSR